MKNNMSRPARALALAVLVVSAVALPWATPARAADPAAGCSTSAGQTTCVFAYTGGPQTWIVPAGASSASFYVYGAQGGTGIVRGGFGGLEFGTISVTPGAAMQIDVGGQGASASSGGAGGWNGGGTGYSPSGGGGGASDVRRGACAASSTCTASDRLIVGGGGGGGAGVDVAGAIYYGGDGGGNSGTRGYPQGSTDNGQGGFSSRGGEGGLDQCNSFQPGGAGGAGFGGAGAHGCTYNGGGGGAGYFGGGGGGALSFAAVQGYSGGGGSGFVDLAMTHAGYGGTRSGSGLVIIATGALKAPIAAKNFSKAVATVDEAVTLTFTITNPNPVAPLTFLQLTDTFPVGLVTVSPGGLREGCNGGVVSSPVGASYITMAGGTLPGGGVCTYAVTVKGYAAGVYNNITNAVTSDQTAAGNAASASIQVGGAGPTLAPRAEKSFSQPTAAVGEPVTLTLTITNPNPTVSLTGLQLSDDLPAGLATVSPTGSSAGCNGGVVTSQLQYVDMAGGSLPPGGTCTYSVTVQGTINGTYVNTTQPVSADVVGNGNSASATLKVGSDALTLPPIAAKSFSKAKADVGESVTLTFTITNPNPVESLTFLQLNDTFPLGLETVSPDGLREACNGGVVSSPVGASYITMSGGTLPGGGICTFAVTVKGYTAGIYTNVANAVTSNQTIPGNAASASIQVGPDAPTLAPIAEKSFSQPTAAVGEPVTLTFTITNPNPTAPLAGLQLFDQFPAGLRTVSATGVTAGCNGGTINSQISYITMADGSLPPGGTCTYAVTVQGIGDGTYVNTTDPVSAYLVGNGNAASATLKVGSDTPTLAPAAEKSFSQPTAAVGEPVTLTFTITNPNPTAPLTGLQLLDSFPAGLHTVSATGATAGCNGGAINAQSGYITMADGSLPPGGTCTYAVTVQGIGDGTYVNTTGPVSAYLVGNGNSASATLKVGSATPTLAPTAEKSFSQPTAAVGEPVTLTFTITNPNPLAPLAGLQLFDSFPAGLKTVSATGAIAGCNGGVINSQPGYITMAGGSLPPGGTCTYAVTVQGTINGTSVNTTQPVSANVVGNGNSASATLNVGAFPPVANAVSAFVDANSANNPIALNITSHAATSVAVASMPAYGTASASGTAISYTPTFGFTGPDSFTYTASNAGGTSLPATVSVFVGDEIFYSGME